MNEDGKNRRKREIREEMKMRRKWKKTNGKE